MVVFISDFYLRVWGLGFRVALCGTLVSFSSCHDGFEFAELQGSN